MNEFFDYEIDQRFSLALQLLGVRSDRDGVRVADGRLRATFGFLNVDVPLSNIASVAVSGPYQWYRAIGPRLSFADHGLTFGTTTNGGVCLEFRTPIRRVVGPWRHPGLTLTVADPEGLVDAIEIGRS